MLKIEDLRVESRLKLVNESMENSNELSNVGWIDFMRSQKSLVVTRLENGVAIINNNYDYCLSDVSIGYFEKLDDRKFKVGDKIKYKGYKSDDLTIKELDDKYERYIFDNDAYLCYKQEEYYELVDKAQYTFDDLIDVANDAVKNKLITQTRFSLSAIGTPLLIVVYFDGREGRYTDDNLFNGIEFIKSLYKETFVIECNGDMYKLKIGDIFSQNGSSVVIDKPLLDLLMNTPLFLTKGAKVERSKG